LVLDTMYNGLNLPTHHCVEMLFTVNGTSARREHSPQSMGDGRLSRRLSIDHTYYILRRLQCDVSLSYVWFNKPIRPTIDTTAKRKAFDSDSI